jgi:tetratricopeptide (TPR) repeat protein
VWTNPARDVLLRARPPAGREGDSIVEFTRSLAALDVDARLSALRDYAEALYAAERPADCVEVLKTVEQLGPLPPEHAQVLAAALQRLGRWVEAARVLREIRRSAPESVHALVATVVDCTGEVAPHDRALAALALSDAGVEVPLDLLVLMVEAALHGGESARALELARSALGQAPSGRRDEAYLGALCALIEGRTADVDAALVRAEELPGSFPPVDFLREERVRVLAQSRGPAGPLALLDDCIARWPDDGRWYAWRAFYRRQALREPAEIELVHADVRAALARPLEPEPLLIATRAAGAFAPEVAEAIAARAAAHPLSWQARIAALFACQPENLRAAVAEAAQLAARPASVYAAMVRLTFDAQAERAGALAREALGDAAQAELRAQFEDATRALLERLAPMAGELGADAEAWNLLADLHRALGEHETFARMLERAFAAEVDAGKLPEELVPLFAWSYLDTGRWTRFVALQASARPGSLDAEGMSWLGATFLATQGRDAEAREFVGAREVPRDPRLARIARPLRALLAARSGEGDAARAELAGLEPGSSLATALAAVALRVLGEPEAADERIGQLGNVTSGLFALVALWRSQPDLDPRELALHAMLAMPGNALLAGATFAREPGLAAFTGEQAVQEYTLERAGGPLAAEHGRLTLTASAKGRVTGTLLLADESALAIQGTLDGYGNLEAVLKRRPAGDVTLLAKLALRAVFDEYPPLAERGQVFLVLDPEGVPYRWLARPTE